MIVFIVLIAFCWIGLSFIVAQYAQKRGQSFAGFLLLGLVVSPVISAIAVLLVADRPSASGDDFDRLGKLQALREGGALTAEEFEAEKQRIMSKRQ